MEHLDGRQEQKSMPAGLVAKKVRRYGDPSKTHPPTDAPKWAVRAVRNPGTIKTSMSVLTVLPWL